MLDFIHTTSEVLKEEMPNVLIKEVNYRQQDTLFILSVRFFDLDFNIVGFDYTYSIESRPLTIEDNLKIEFTNYVNNKIKPILELKGN